MLGMPDMLKYISKTLPLSIFNNYNNLEVIQDAFYKKTYKKKNLI